MTRGALFWILMILWLLSALAPVVGLTWPYWGVGSSLLLLVLLALLGWQVFGPAIKG